jgi:serine/threonine-protein phosphatase 2A regulatory subunit B
MAGSPAGAAAAGGARLAGPLRLPTVVGSELLLASRTKRVFANAHTYHINSISINSDQESFLSADDLRINLWNLEVNDQSFNIVDIKPQNMEDLTEVITSAEFHPQHCNVFAYSSSKGCIRLADMRGAALCDRHAKAFEEVDQHQGSKSFFSEIIASISDIRFSNDGRYMLSRDYMTVKLWDLAKEDAPVATYSVHEPLRQRVGGGG